MTLESFITLISGSGSAALVVLAVGCWALWKKNTKLEEDLKDITQQSLKVMTLIVSEQNRYEEWKKEDAAWKQAVTDFIRRWEIRNSGERS